MESLGSSHAIAGGALEADVRTAEAASEAGLALSQEHPKKVDEAAPHEERERESQQQAVAASGVSSRGGTVFTASVVSGLVVTQLAWLALLGYLAYLLFQL